MLSLPASIKGFDQEQPRKIGDIVFPIISLWGFFRRSRAANSAISGPIRPKFKHVQAPMHVIVTYKYEKERMKNSREKVETLYFPIITLSVTMETGDWIWPNFKLIQALMYVIITCKYVRFQSRTAAKKWRHHFSHYKPMGIFSDVQGQFTPQSVVPAGRNSNSSELSCMSSLPARMKKIREKQLRKSGDTVFSIITLWELSVATETRVLIQYGEKLNAAFPPPQ